MAGIGPDTRLLVEHVSQEELRRHVSILAASDRSSTSAPEAHARALEYIRGVFQKANLEIRDHTFTYSGRSGSYSGRSGSYSGRSGTNLIGRKVGSEAELASLLVSAHYDTVTGSPGADDNASGVAALLECARVLDTVHLKRTIEYVVFDMEEAQPEGEGLVGSSAFVRDEASSTGYDGVYNLEMVGFTSGPGTQRFPPGFELLFPEIYQHVDERGFTGDLLVVTSMGQSAALGRRMAAEAASYVPDLDVVSLELDARMPLPPDFFRSDHASFWEAEIPAVMVTDTANFRNPNYHTARDTADTLDYGFLHKVTRVLVATVSGHAQD